MPKTRGRYYNQSLARGLAILGLFNAERSWLGLSEIAALTGLNRATALRLVSTLSELGFLERSAATKKYRPGVAVLTLGYSALGASDLKELALPYLEELFSEVVHTVNMGVLVGAEVLYTERLKSNELLVSNVHVGSTLPAYCTSMGKVLLAHLPGDELDELLASIRLERRGPKTITDRRTLRKELAEIRELGLAIQDEEVIEGLMSVAAPICDSSGRVVAAINTSVPTALMTSEQLRNELAPKVAATAEKISRISGSSRESYQTALTRAP